MSWVLFAVGVWAAMALLVLLFNYGAHHGASVEPPGEEVEPEKRAA